MKLTERRLTVCRSSDPQTQASPGLLVLLCAAAPQPETIHLTSSGAEPQLISMFSMGVCVCV